MADCVTALTPVFNGVVASAEAVCAQMSQAASAATLAADNPIAVGLNTLYLLSCGALVFVMHAGFAMLCAGAIRSKNTMNILLQTVMDAAVSAIAFYAVGYAFAYGVGDTPNGFIGNSQFALARFAPNNLRLGNNNGVWWQNWFFQWAFAATATTIPAGAVAERLNFNAYLIYSFFISAFVYPVVVHWVWSGEGWLGLARSAAYSHLFRSGMIDYAGSAVVHMVGGLSGLAGCVLLGPRLGRFDSNGKPVDMPGHSATLVVLGTVLLWFGWYGFNPGSMITIASQTSAMVAGRSAVTTTLSGAAGCLSCLLTAFFRNKAWDLLAGCNGALVGFVTITAGANVLEPWAAIIAGFTGGWVFDAVCALFLKLRIDDPLAAAPMHGFCGAWGVFFVGLLAKKAYVCEAYGATAAGCSAWLTDGSGYVPDGLFYNGDGRLLASQVIGIITIATWVIGLMSLLFGGLKLLGLLRISSTEEHAGLDVSKHGGSAYNYDHGLGKPEKAPAPALHDGKAPVVALQAL